MPFILNQKVMKNNFYYCISIILLKQFCFFTDIVLIEISKIIYLIRPVTLNYCNISLSMQSNILPIECLNPYQRAKKYYYK